MENTNHSEDSNPDIIVEVDPTETQPSQNQITELEDQGNELANALFRSERITMECLAWTAIFVAILELVLLFVIFILILNKY